MLRPRDGALDELSPTSYLEVFKATPFQRVSLIKAGLRARDAKRILADLAAPSGQIYEALKISPAAITRRAAKDQTLSPRDSERIIGVARLVGQVEAMVGSEEGFDASAWLANWLVQPAPALGGQRPGELIDTMEGQSLVSKLLAQMQSGAYA